jgi:hypothetical protein
LLCSCVSEAAPAVCCAEEEVEVSVVMLCIRQSNPPVTKFISLPKKPWRAI